MAEHRGPGRIIHLNGGSSAGKTSIALELQRQLEEPHLVLGIDTFIRMLPQRLFGSAEGWRFVPVDDGGVRVEIGMQANRTFGAMYDAVAVLCRSGNHIIFDDVLTLPDMLERMVKAWRDLDVHLVGVRCAVDVAEARERARGDRAIGLARGSSARAHRLFQYDIEVDSGALSASECAGLIARFVRTRPVGAFTRLSPR